MVLVEQNGVKKQITEEELEKLKSSPDFLVEYVNQVYVIRQRLME